MNAAAQADRLTEAIQHGNVEGATGLLSRGADPDGVSSRGRPLLIEAVRANRLPLVRLLLDRGADVHAATETGDTVIHAAAWAGRAPLISALLPKMRPGAVNARTREGNTPMHYAVCGENTACVQALLRARADLTVLNRHGHSAWQMLDMFSAKPTRSNRAIARMIEAAVARPFNEDLACARTDRLLAFAKAGFGTRTHPDLWTNAVAATAQRGDEKTTTWLLRHGARPDGAALMAWLDEGLSIAPEVRCRTVRSLLWHEAFPENADTQDALLGRAQALGLKEVESWFAQRSAERAMAPAIG